MKHPLSMKHAPLLFLFAAALWLASPSHAQTSYWSNPNVGEDYVAAEIIKPIFDDDRFASFSAPSSAIFFSGRFSISETASFVAELPFAYAKVDDARVFSDGDGDFAVGNPYLGLEIRTGEQTVVDMGLRLAFLTDGDGVGNLFGGNADLDRNATFGSNTVALRVVPRYTVETESDFSFRFHLGPEVFFPVGADSGFDPELFLSYGAQSWYQGSTTSFGIGLTGNAFVTSGNFNFGDSTYHQLTLTTLFNLEDVRPGILVRLPVDDNLDYINAAIGLTFTVPL